MRLAWVFLIALPAACGGRPPPPPAKGEVEWMAMETGMACATAQVACGSGNCAANLRNRCREPITCQLTVQSVCRAYTGESGEAMGRSHDTFASGDGGGILARVVCSDGEVELTRAKELHCESDQLSVVSYQRL